MGRADEDKLCADLAAGRDEAFAQLVGAYGPGLYRTAATLLANRHDADEVVQELFVNLVRSQRALAKVDDLRSYLYAALRRACYRWIAVRNERQRTLRVLADEAAREERSVLDKSHDVTDELQAAVAGLPIEQREILALKLDGDLTFREIGQLLEISQNTAASRYRYALARLRQALKGTHE